MRDAVGFALADDQVAPHPLPRFDNSAMDGYAVRADDCVSPDARRSMSSARSGRGIPANQGASRHRSSDHDGSTRFRRARMRSFQVEETEERGRPGRREDLGGRRGGTCARPVTTSDEGTQRDTGGDRDRRRARLRCSRRSGSRRYRSFARRALLFW